MLVSEAKARELQPKEERWGIIAPTLVQDATGVDHVCSRTIKVSYRWGPVQVGTTREKLYVSPQLRLKRRTNLINEQVEIDLLVFRNPERPPPVSASTVQPFYQMPRQSQGAYFTAPGALSDPEQPLQGGKSSSELILVQKLVSGKRRAMPRQIRQTSRPRMQTAKRRRPNMKRY
jgi:hypothetical protein